MIQWIFFVTGVVLPMTLLADDKVEYIAGKVLDKELKGFKEIPFGMTATQLSYMGFECTRGKGIFLLDYRCEAESLEDPNNRNLKKPFTLLGQPAAVTVQSGVLIEVRLRSLSQNEIFTSFEQVYGPPSFTSIWKPADKFPFEVVEKVYWVFRNGAAISTERYPNDDGYPFGSVKYISADSAVWERWKKLFKDNGLDIDKKPINLKDL